MVKACYMYSEASKLPDSTLSALANEFHQRVTLPSHTDRVALCHGDDTTVVKQASQLLPIPPSRDQVLLATGDHEGADFQEVSTAASLCQ
jgi:hypothetical protein